MSAPMFLLACLGGGIGACLRFVVDGLVMRRVSSGFPLGIFLINATGSFLLGFLTGLADSSVVDGTWLFIISAGVMGGYTTFSTAMVDTVHLLREEAWGRAAVNAAGMLVAGVVLALIGLAAGRAL